MREAALFNLWAESILVGISMIFNDISWVCVVLGSVSAFVYVVESFRPQHLVKK